MESLRGTSIHLRHHDPFVLSDPFHHVNVNWSWPNIWESFRSKLRRPEPDPEQGVTLPEGRQYNRQHTQEEEQERERKREFMTRTLPAFLYLNFLMRLPAMYFTRVNTVFQDAEVSRNEMNRMIEASTRGAGLPGGYSDAPGRVVPPGNSSASAALGLAGTIGTVPGYSALPFPEDWTSHSVSPALVRFKNSWEDFIDSLLREWKTLNIVSALLLS